MTKSLHTVLTELKATLRTLEGDTVYELSRKVLDRMPVTAYGREMRLSALDALDNVLDGATNSGTVENLFELREALDNYGDFDPSQDNEETTRLLGELWNFSFAPSSLELDYDTEPLAAVMNTWNAEIGCFAHEVLFTYVEETFPEYNF